jgi:hypothetical protein
MHRVTQVHLTVRAGFRSHFDDPQGLVALKLQAEDDTTSRKDDDELTVFGVNSGENALIYNTSLTSIAFYGEEGSGIGQFRHPQGIAASRDGHVVVADTGNDRLHVLSYADDQLHHVRFIQGEFAGKPLRQPLGVALEVGEIYVCDPENDRILVLDLQGALQRVLAPTRDGEPLLIRPFSVAVIRGRSDFNYFGDDFVVVVDSSQSRLVQLTPTGEVRVIRRLGELGRRAGRFHSVAVDFYANVYCSDLAGMLHKFDREMRTLLSIGRPGTGDYEFDEPRGIGLYRRFGQIFVAERAGAQYLWTGTDVFTPSLVNVKHGEDDTWSGTVRYFLTEYARVGLELVDSQERSVVLLQPPRWQSVGAVTTPVTFRLPRSAGVLRLRVEAVPTYSSRSYLQVQRLGPPMTMFTSREGDP